MSAPMTVEKTRNWETGAFVKPDDIIVPACAAAACAERQVSVTCGGGRRAVSEVPQLSERGGAG